MSRFLNLDELVGESGKIVFQGKEYLIPEMAVEQFIELLKAQKQAEEDGDETKALDNAVKTIGTLIPDMPEEVIGKFNMKQLQAVMKFIVDDVQGDQEGNE